jgi:uridine kinase
VGISGIDGSDKGYISERIHSRVRQAGLSCVLIGIDGWLQPPSKRFCQQDPASHFYQHGFRFDEMQKLLFEPLRRRGVVDVVAQHADPTNREQMVDYHYRIDRPDVVIFEGIFLLQKRFVFDCSVWIECSFETALERALKRNQEGLTDHELERDYSDIYFAAQKMHMNADRPQARCDAIVLNDERQESR